MKALKLAVAEPSAILRCGIIAVLRRLPAPDVDILEIADISQLTVQLSRHRPDWSSTRLRWDFVRPSN